MLVPTIGLELDECRPFARTRVSNGFPGKGVDRIRIVPVGLSVEHTVCFSKLDYLSIGGLTYAQWRQHGIEVILTYHDHRQFVECSNIETFVKDSGFSRSVAKEDDGYSRFA